jgi:hypothetical protein
MSVLNRITALNMSRKYKSQRAGRWILYLGLEYAFSWLNVNHPKVVGNIKVNELEDGHYLNLEYAFS